MCWRKGRHAGARACPFAPLVPVSRGPGALPCGVGQRVRWSDGVSAKGRNPRVARDHVLGGPAELLGANDAKATVEQAVAKEAVLLVLGVGPDGTGLQVEVEDYALSPRARLDAAPEGAACPLGQDDHGLGVIALHMIEYPTELVEVMQHERDALGP